MQKTRISILAGICTAGALTGFTARKTSPAIAPPSASYRSAASGSRSNGASEVATDPGLRAKTVLPEISIVRSTDTVESLLKLDPEGNYGRIALWTATASVEELAAYWAAYKGDKRSYQVTDLIFLNWTRRDPQGAMAAVVGTGDERYAWWSWAANDPAAALAAARGGDRERMAQVTSGIGEFDPEWLQEHLDEIPEEFRKDAFGRMKNWTAGQDPLESLTFMKANGMGVDHGLFKKLVQKDPWAALDWVKENSSNSLDPYKQDSLMDVLVSGMVEDHPEELERLASQTPAGAAKRTMEQALFDRLLETDPAAALEQVRKSEASLVVAQQLGQIGLEMVATEPDKAFEVAAEILKANPETLDIRDFIQYENGSTWSHSPGKATELMEALFDKDREKTLEMMAAQTSGEKKVSEVLFTYAGRWATDDLVEFSEWANQQTGTLHQVAAQQIGNELANQGQFLEAMEWAKNGTLPPDKAYNGVLFNWTRADPEAAAAWVENADLTETQKAGYRDLLKSYRR